MTDTTGWDGILSDGEKILWQGRPDGKIVFKLTNIFTLIFGTFFAGFALIWMILASSAGGFFWMFGLIHFFAGLGVMLGPILWPAWSRRHTWYTLTNQRAFIAKDMPVVGRSLKSYELEAKAPLDHRIGPPCSVYFASEHRRTKNGSREHRIGFERIDDGAEVYRLIRDVKTSLK